MCVFRFFILFLIIFSPIGNIFLSDIFGIFRHFLQTRNSVCTLRLVLHAFTLFYLSCYGFIIIYLLFMHYLKVFYLIFAICLLLYAIFHASSLACKSTPLLTHARPTIYLALQIESRKHTYTHTHASIERHRNVPATLLLLLLSLQSTTFRFFAHSIRHATDALRQTVNT